MTNERRSDDFTGEEGFSSWRSFGAVAAVLTARVEAQRQDGSGETETFVPVAWAAE